MAPAAPSLCWLLDAYQAWSLGGGSSGLEFLLLNGALTWAGMRLLSAPATAVRRARG